MFNVSMPELLVILVAVLLVFGPGKLPEVGKALGKGLSEFKKVANGDGVKDVLKAEPVKIEERKL